MWIAGFAIIPSPTVADDPTATSVCDAFVDRELVYPTLTLTFRFTQIRVSSQIELLFTKNFSL